MIKKATFTVLAMVSLAACSPTTSTEINDSRLRADQAYTRSTASSEDVEAEIQLGRALSARILARYKLRDNPRQQKYINLVGQTLSRSSGRPALQP